MHSIGDIMKEMQIVPSATPQPNFSRAALASRLQANLQTRLQEYSCGQLSEEDYLEDTNPWAEWPYCWIGQLNNYARQRFHSFHQNHYIECESQPGHLEEQPEYSQVTAQAA